MVLHRSASRIRTAHLDEVRGEAEETKQSGMTEEDLLHQFISISMAK
jgi:hypothetical protein